MRKVYPRGRFPKISAVTKKSGWYPDKNRKFSSIKLIHEPRQNNDKLKSQFLSLILSLWINQAKYFLGEIGN